MKYAWVIVSVASLISACSDESSKQIDSVCDTVEVFIVPEGRAKISLEQMELTDVQQVDTINNSASK